MRRLLRPLSLLVALAPAAWSQARLERPQLRANLRLAVGTTVAAAITFRLEPGWHLYWKNPGDAGLPLAVTWKLPPGWKQGPLEFPVPVAHPGPEGLTYIHEGQVTFLATLIPPPHGPAAEATVTAELDWLVCKEDCLPGRGVLTAKVLGGLDRLSPMELAGMRTKLPRPSDPDLAMGPVEVRRQSDRVVATFRLGGPAAAKAIAFFPDVPEGYTVLHSEVKVEAGQVILPLRPTKAAAPAARLKGLLHLGTHAVQVDVPLPSPEP